MYDFFTEEGEMTLDGGEHRLPFQITLPANLPSSFEGFHG